MENITVAYQRLTMEFKICSKSLNDEREIRKKLHNELEDIKGKIRVFCRIRPL